MKIYIRAMAFKRRDAERHIATLSSVIVDHLIKCLVYGDSLHCYRHWVDDELTLWFSQIDTAYLKIDRKPPKFRRDEYDEMIFGQFGEDPHDCSICLSTFTAEYCERYGGTYPDFDISSDLISDTYKAITELSRKMCSAIAASSQKDPVGMNRIRQILHECLDKYCL